MLQYCEYSMAMIDTSIDKTTIPVQDEGNERRHDLVAQKMSVLYLVRLSPLGE